ncbi:zinc finger BED domain-containing protein 1-like [Silurus asotus]|uniref:Zinc finger BED domain-containing protein 1-like n=1 Tax=Silurus asotus TaxID=30991 RepID=A0AAD5B3V8_SILAS|nr:zinc finger BED domain-containing protein 1-like [Silurus asotus]
MSLQTSYFPDDHTGEIIGQELKDAMAFWKLVKDRQACVTTDSGKNMIKAMKMNNWTHLQCFGHRLHNAIEHGVKDHRVDIKSTILHYLNCKYSEPVTAELLSISSLMDPRFRTTCIDMTSWRESSKRMLKSWHLCCQTKIFIQQFR